MSNQKTEHASVSAITASSKRHMITAGAMSVLSFMLMGGIPGASMAVLLPIVKAEMELTSVQAASLNAGLSLGTALLAFVAGVIMDKVSTRKLMFAFGLGAALMVGLRSVEMPYPMLYLLFLMLGLFHGIIGPGCNKIIALWFPQRYIFMMNSMIMSGAAVAFIIGLNFTLPLADLLGGWRNFYVGLGIVLALLAALWLVLVPERSSQNAALNADIAVKHAERSSYLDNIKIVLSSGKVWALCFAEFFFGGVISTITSLGTSAIFETYGGRLTVQNAASIASIGNLGSLLGYLILPFVLTKFFPKANYIWPVLISMCLSGLLWSLGMSFTSVPLLVFCLALGSFWNGFGYVGPRTMLMQLPEVAGLRAGTGLGIFNTVAQLGQMIIVSFAGFLAVFLGGYQNAVRITYLLAFLGAACLMIYKFLLDKESALS